MGSVDKLTLNLNGRPLLAHTVSTFLSWPRLTGLAVSVTEGREEEFKELLRAHCSSLDKVVILAGGDQRQDSIRRALECLEEKWHPGSSDIALIHDGARPFVDAELFDNLVTNLASCDAVIPATPVRDTIKRVNGPIVVGTEDRETLRLVQTPQAFRFSAILDLHKKAERESFYGTDDASLVEKYNGVVRWIPGSPLNLKVTVPEDIALVGELMAARNERR